MQLNTVAVNAVVSARTGDVNGPTLFWGKIPEPSGTWTKLTEPTGTWAKDGSTL